MPLQKPVLLIADTDEHYARELARYITSDFSEVFGVMCCTSPDYLEELLRQKPFPADILLISAELYDTAGPYGEIPAVILLTRGKPSDSYKDVEAVNKYQLGEKLVNSIRSIYSGRSGNVAGFRENGKKTAITGLYSASGGTGKTSVAVSLGLTCSQLGMSVLYVCLECFCSFGCFSQSEKGLNLSNIIYYLKNKTVNYAQKVCGVFSFDPGCRMWYIPPPDSALDYEEFTSDEIAVFLSLLRETGRFDLVLLDLPCGFDRKTVELLDVCDELLVVSAPGVTHEARLGTFVEEIRRLEKRRSLGISGKTVHVLNKAAANPEGGPRSLFDEAGASGVTLPEIAEIAYITSPQRFLRLPAAYTAGIKELALRYVSAEER